MSNILKNSRPVYAIIFLLYGIATIHHTQGQCTATSVSNPVRVVDSSAPGGNFSFGSPANAILSDNNHASAAALISLFNGQTDYLKATGFGFSIPLSAIICGIKVEVEKSATGIGHILFLESYITDLTVNLVKNGVIVGSNKADVSTHWGNTDSYFNYGSSSDNWSAGLVAADINSSKFGVVFAADLHGLASLIPNALIDNIRITVYYLDALLPVTLLDFNASANNKTVLLNWKVPVENQAALSLQRSPDGNKWEALPGISIKQNAITNSFSAEDYNPYAGTSYYRVKMTDPSGKESYSASKSVVFDEGPGIKVFPNPFSNYIQLTGIGQDDRISLTDAYGKQILLPAIPVHSNNMRLDVTSLKPGIYFIRAGKATMKIQKL